jgi:rhodanese-related sulfurtransferase
LVPRGLLEFKIASNVANQNAKIVVYCKSGGRSSLATLSLVRMGYVNAVSMNGGFTEWANKGYPIDE